MLEKSYLYYTRLAVVQMLQVGEAYRYHLRQDNNSGTNCKQLEVNLIGCRNRTPSPELGDCDFSTQSFAEPDMNCAYLQKF